MEWTRQNGDTAWKLGSKWPWMWGWFWAGKLPAGFRGWEPGFGKPPTESTRRKGSNLFPLDPMVDPPPFFSTKLVQAAIEFAFAACLKSTIELKKVTPLPPMLVSLKRGSKQATRF